MTKARWGGKGFSDLYFHITVHHQRSQDRNSNTAEADAEVMEKWPRNGLGIQEILKFKASKLWDPITLKLGQALSYFEREEPGHSHNQIRGKPNSQQCK